MVFPTLQFLVEQYIKYPYNLFSLSAPTNRRALLGCPFLAVLKQPICYEKGEVTLYGLKGNFSTSVEVISVCEICDFLCLAQTVCCKWHLDGYKKVASSP